MFILQILRSLARNKNENKASKASGSPERHPAAVWQDPSAPSRPGAGAGAGTASAGPRRCRSLRKPAAGGRALSRNQAYPSSGALNRDSPGKRRHTPPRPPAGPAPQPPLPPTSSAPSSRMSLVKLEIWPVSEDRLPPTCPRD